MTKPVVLCILDGWGLSDNSFGNAVAQANTPNFDWMWGNCPAATLITHGEAVGLPAGSIGNSEVGHLHIGAGRTILMEMQRINAAIASGAFQGAPKIRDFADRILRAGGKAHVAGLVTDVGVHALTSHIAAAVEALADLGLPVVVHAFTDGRDSPPGMAQGNLSRLQRILPAAASVGTVSGRYFPMDRDRRWDRVRRGWEAIVLGRGMSAEDCETAVASASARGETDEFISPTVVGGYAGLGAGDGLFLANFRSDRMRQIAAAICDEQFDGFDTRAAPKPAAALGMAPYFEDAPPWIDALFAKPVISETLGEWAARHGRTQFRLAETEKYPHVTFFLNGGKEKRETGEQRFMAQSPGVATYDLAPEMAAAEVTDRFIAAVQAGFDLIVVNYANPDMVGHTGSLAAAVKACEAVDRGLGKAIAAVDAAGGAILVTADHGNCETMIDPDTGAPHTAHTTNPVPAILYGGPENARLSEGTLSDIAPTLLKLMGIQQAPLMTGASLIG